MKRIALVGTAPASMHLAPCMDPTWTIWACSPGTMNISRIDRFFELHRWEPGADWFPASYVNFLQNFKGEVTMGGPVPEIPNCRVIDWQGLVERWGPYFFTSSLAWMCAMAIEEGADEIGFWGVDMAAQTEYKDQRLGCQYFAIQAGLRGIKVTTPPESDLLRPAPLYGVCEWSHLWIKETARAREIAGRIREAQERMQQDQQTVSFLQGALDDQDWHLHSAVGNLETMGNATQGPILPGNQPPIKTENAAVSGSGEPTQ